MMEMIQNTKRYDGMVSQCPSADYIIEKHLSQYSVLASRYSIHTRIATLQASLSSPAS